MTVKYVPTDNETQIGSRFAMAPICRNIPTCILLKFHNYIENMIRGQLWLGAKYDAACPPPYTHTHPSPPI